ncbi:MAG: SPFH domain-containing protein [Chloroflexota bacterium]
MERFRRLAGSASLSVGVVIVIAVCAVLIFSQQFYYFFERIDEQEVGVQLQGGRITGVVGPGVYSDFGLYVRLERISSQAIPFTVTDEEIITKDKQRLGLTVSGDIFRPNESQVDVIESLWSKYRSIYLDDTLAIGRVHDLARQSMKVCIGERRFDDAIIGNARDDLRNCIDEELSGLAEGFGLDIQNVVVPEVILGPAVQAALDEIVQSRLKTEKAAQEKLRVSAEAEAEQAKQEGEIRIAQSRIQEEAKQQTALAQLEQEKIAAQKAVIEAERANELARVEAERAIIEAQKANELLAAEQDLAINKALAAAAIERAKAELAGQAALAEIFASNPGYLELQMIEANAGAIKPTDKLIFTPEGTTPNLVIPGPGIIPTVDTQVTTE